LAFVLVNMARVEGCDRGDGAAFAWMVAVALDVAAMTLLVVLWFRRDGRIPLAPTALVLIPGVTLAVVSLLYVNSLGTGCPV
jgi:hypothetical protein